MTIFNRLNRIHLSRLVLLVSALSAALLISACSLFEPTVKGTVQDTVEVNEAVGESEANMMLLNVLRAMRKQPLVFTNYAQFNEGLPSSSLQVTFAAPLDKSTLQPTIKGDTQSFTANPMDQNQAFIRNIMSMISPDTVMYYHNKGWPTSLLLHLFVSEIVVHPSTSHEDILATYSNYPYVLATYDRFGAVANELAGCSMHSTETPMDADANKKGAATHGGTLIFTRPAVTGTIAATACASAIQQLTANGETYELIYRSPLDAVRYLGDVVREQTSGDDYDSNKSYPENIGIVAYSDACFFQQASSHGQACAAYCNALFEIQTDPPRGAKFADAVCAHDAAMTFAGQPVKPEAEDLKPWSVSYQGPTYYLPLRYMDHSETLHVMSILELLIGYQAGT